MQSPETRPRSRAASSDAAGPPPSTDAATAELDAALRELLRRGVPSLQATVEQRLVHAAYKLCGHNQVRSAQLLGISRSVLRRQLIRFGYLERTGLRRATRPPAPSRA